MKKVQLEYGEGLMEAELPDSAEVFIPGETVPDPPALEDPLAATRESLRHPLGLPPIGELVRKGCRVTISFPDRVKGGFQETSHRRTAIPLLIEECLEAGVREEDILLICATGLHRKNTPEEIRSLLGDALYDRFAPAHRLVNHDSEDWDHLVDLGLDELGDRVILNREVFESDLAILVGHVLGNPYGGYSGGYKMAATGLTHWKSIASHHVPQVMHLPDFTPVSGQSTMRRKLDAIGRHMEARMGRKFFMCDAVLDTRMRQIAVFSGWGEEVQPASWQVADRRTYLPWAKEKFDLMIFGMPQAFHYGDGHGTNPILILQAIAANVIRHRRVLADNAVVLCASLCNGYFHDEEFPSYRPLYELFQKGGRHELPELARYGELFCRDEKLLAAYRWGWGYHPYHAFSMIACGQIAHRHCAAIYIVGAREPGWARGMGMKTRATFAQALEDARRYTGPDPKILALPRTFLTAGVHLMMRGEGEGR